MKGIYYLLFSSSAKGSSVLIERRSTGQGNSWEQRGFLKVLSKRTDETQEMLTEEERLGSWKTFEICSISPTGITAKSASGVMNN